VLSFALFASSGCVQNEFASLVRCLQGASTLTLVAYITLSFLGSFVHGQETLALWHQAAGTACQAETSIIAAH
jgi:hypothetical protein